MSVIRGLSITSDGGLEFIKNEVMHPHVKISSSREGEGNSGLRASKNAVSSLSSGSFLSYSSNDSVNVFNNEVSINLNLLLSFLRSEDYVEGDITKTQLFLESLYLKNNFLFGEVFQKAWVALYKNTHELTKYLCIASCIDYEMLKDKADVFILGAASHSDPYVNEAALRAAEAWAEPKFLEYLAKLRDFEFDWLNDYKISVMSYLEHLK
ncbi:hypothetical protein ACAX51_001057 [Serratia marcescens]